MRISEIMHTPAVTCTPAATVADAAQLMAARNVGCVVVIGPVGEAVGIVTDRDITVRVVAVGRSADIPVEAVMTRSVATADPGADVAVAAATMLKRGVRRLPVVDVHSHVHGLVALDDLVRHVAMQADQTSDVVFSQLLTSSLEP